MSVLVHAWLTGDPDDLVAAIDSLTPEFWSAHRSRGLVSVVVARTDGGVLMSEVWESAERFKDRLDDPVIQRDLAATGLNDLVSDSKIGGPYFIQALPAARPSAAAII
jgi:hypothetical protein